MENIIPELLKELKCNYESKNFLSANERGFLCNSIVDYFVSRKIKFSLDTMDELAEQIVEHFPKEDKVFPKNNEILERHTFLKDLFSNSRRNPGIIVMVLTDAVAFFPVLVPYAEKWPKKPTTHPLQKLSLTLPQVRMMIMQSNL